MITIEFVLALEKEQRIETVVVQSPITLKELLPQCTLYKRVLETIPKPLFGVFNQIIADDYLLIDGDRIEVYRPLIIDPKTARQIRAERKAKALRQAEQATKQ